ncbi:uncharacterized protein LOC141705359 [Apium graveolens]|uniref:uncharacterized protein LOC141704933 n=1 Tax=Apium graveolens TaxID=4045 RepID=UPI003D7BB2D0
MASEKGKCTLDLNTPSGEVKRKRGRPLKSQATRNLVLSPGSAGSSLSVMGAVSSPPAMSAVSSMPMRVAVVSPPVPRAISELQPAFNLSPSAENSVRGQVGEAVIVYGPRGQFQILSLTGSFTVAETGMGRCRTGGVSVSLACPDGHVIGGAVAGPLVPEAFTYAC